MRKSLFEAVGGIDTEIPGGHGEDYDFLLRIINHTTIRVVIEPLVNIYWNGSSYYFKKWEMIDKALGYLIDKHDFSESPEGLARVLGQQGFCFSGNG